MLPTQAVLEISPSIFVPLVYLPGDPEPLVHSTFSQETPWHLPHVQGVLELSQYDSRDLHLMPSTHWHRGNPSIPEGSKALLPSAQGSMGHSLSAQEAVQISKSTQGTLVHYLSALGDMTPFLSSHKTVGSLSSISGYGIYSGVPESPEHLRNISGFSGSLITDHDPVRVSLPYLHKELSDICHQLKVMWDFCLLKEIQNCPH